MVNGYIIRESKYGRFYLAMHKNGVRVTPFKLIKKADAAPELYANVIIETWNGVEYVRRRYNHERRI